MQGLAKRNIFSSVFPRASLLALLLTLLSPGLAFAEIEWLLQAKDCESFSAGLKKYFAGVSETSELTPEQQKELPVILDEACNFQFVVCFPNFCKQRFEQRNPKPAQSKEDLAEQFSGELAFLNSELSCDELLDEIKERFSRNGKTSAISAEVKAGLKSALCSDKFVHCGYCKQ